MTIDEKHIILKHTEYHQNRFFFFCKIILFLMSFYVFTTGRY